jgi:ferrous-iron efflux pump FieF
MTDIPAAAARPEDQRLLKLASYASVSVAATLIAAKTIAWGITDSVAMLSTLLDSMFDLLASFITFIAIREATKPADREHRFGHGKAEALAAMAQAAFIAGSAMILIFQAANRFIHPIAVTKPEIGIWVTVGALAATMALVMFQRWVVNRTGSLAITADSLHYLGDILMNAAVIAALYLNGWLGWLYADPLFGLLIAGFILHAAWGIAKHALDMLMDRELPEKERQRIYEIALDHPDTHTAHDLKTRRSGNRRFIQLHLEMNADLSLTEAHDIADDVEQRILEAFPDAEVIIHQDPEGIDEDHPKYR